MDLSGVDDEKGGDAAGGGEGDSLLHGLDAIARDQRLWGNRDCCGIKAMLAGVVAGIEQVAEGVVGSIHGADDVDGVSGAAERENVALSVVGTIEHDVAMFGDGV